MVYPESKKLHLISSLISENDDEVLKKIEQILLRDAGRPITRFANFSNKLSKEELEEFERNIEAGCEKVDENDWK